LGGGAVERAQQAVQDLEQVAELDLEPVGIVRLEVLELRRGAQ